MYLHNPHKPQAGHCGGGNTTTSISHIWPSDALWRLFCRLIYYLSVSRFATKKHIKTQNFLQIFYTTQKNFLHMIKRPSIALIYDRRHIATATKEALVEVRVSYAGKSIYFSSGVTVKANEWRNGRVIRRLDINALNERIDKTFADISAKADELMQSNCFTLDNLRAAVINGHLPKVPMWEWLIERINERPLAASTKRQHISAINFIKNTGIFISWHDLTPANLKRLDELLRRSGLSQVSIYGYHKRLKPYLRDAVVFGIIARSPYEQFRTPKGRSERRRYLTGDECKKIEAATMSTLTLEHAKDCWLFQRYTGLAYADLAALTAASFVESNGSTYILTKRQKNGSPVLIKLIDKALALLNKNGGTLPVVNLSSYNAQLKQVALLAGINKPLTSHMARHTFATQALHAGVAIEVVSKMLAHADIQTTQLYAKVLAEDIEAGFDMLNK